MLDQATTIAHRVTARAALKSISRLLNRTADLLLPAVAHKEKSAALFANPDFNLAEASYRKSLASLGVPDSGSLASVIPQLKGSGTTLGGCTQLPQVRSLEIGVTNQIAPLLRDHGWTAKTFVEEQALVETVQKVRAPRLLHIATHGDFLPDPDAKKPTSVEANHTPLPLIFDPMLRSRLFFAGANQTLAGHPLPRDLSDGILTAYQASTLTSDGRGGGSNCSIWRNPRLSVTKIGRPTNYLSKAILSRHGTRQENRYETCDPNPRRGGFNGRFCVICWGRQHDDDGHDQRQHVRRIAPANRSRSSTA
jgi:hypothetical protein